MAGDSRGLAYAGYVPSQRSYLLEVACTYWHLSLDSHPESFEIGSTKRSSTLSTFVRGTCQCYGLRKASQRSRQACLGYESQQNSLRHTMHSASSTGHSHALPLVSGIRSVVQVPLEGRGQRDTPSTLGC